MFFDILMEGQLNQQTGEYAISYKKDREDEYMDESDAMDEQLDNESHSDGGFKKSPGMQYEPRSFMFCNFLHHAGLTNIQYKTFFHMCRLESISFDMESRSGSTFCLYDCLASGVIGMLTIGVHRKATTKFMMEALNFIQNQAGLMPKKVYANHGGTEVSDCDQLAVYDVVQRVKMINRAFEKQQKEKGEDITGDQKTNVSFMNTAN